MRVSVCAFVQTTRLRQLRCPLLHAVVAHSVPHTCGDFATLYRNTQQQGLLPWNGTTTPTLALMTRAMVWYLVHCCVFDTALR